MIAAHCVVVCDRSSLGEDRFGYRALDRPPLVDLLAAPGRRKYREVRRRSIRVDVREPAGHLAPGAARLPHGLLGCGQDPLVEAGKPLPGDRRLECLADDSHGDQHVAHVGRA